MILIIDDEPMLCDLLEEVLSEAGYRVLTAPDGETGVQLYLERHHEIRAVITDQSLPHLSGEDVCRLILERNPSARIIVATGHYNKDLNERFARLGIKTMMHKPYQLTDVIETLARVLA